MKVIAILSQLKKHDMVTGETVTWRDEQYDVIGEPVFVASPQPNSEDDGTYVRSSTLLLRNVRNSKSKLMTIRAVTDFCLCPVFPFAVHTFHSVALGIVMAPLLATREEQCSGLVILDAKTFTELARAYSPPHVKVPMTFHGDFDNVRLDATSS